MHADDYLVRPDPLAGLIDTLDGLGQARIGKQSSTLRRRRLSVSAGPFCRINGGCVAAATVKRIRNRMHRNTLQLTFTPAGAVWLSLTQTAARL
jgi:hypothetical protein